MPAETTTIKLQWSPVRYRQIILFSGYIDAQKAAWYRGGMSTCTTGACDRAGVEHVAAALVAGAVFRTCQGVLDEARRDGRPIYVCTEHPEHTQDSIT